MDALTLKELHESQLREELKRPPTPESNRREMSCMLRVSRSMTPGALFGHDPARTWVWSDLHLGHTKTIKVFQRPFGTADEMNDRIFRNWEQVVAPADTILMLGDVTVHGLWGRRLKRVHIRPRGGRSSCTGTTRSPARAWWRPTVSTKCTAACTWGATRPYSSHTCRFESSQRDCVNIHGHLHHTHVPGKTRHINVCVEQLQYRPRALSALRKLAQRLVEGVSVRGRTTGDKLDQIG